VHAKPKQLDEVRSDINVTPLVDVCLVLLIIFMVVTPMLSRGKDVPLPKTRHTSRRRTSASSRSCRSTWSTASRPTGSIRTAWKTGPTRPRWQQITKRTEAELTKKMSKGVTAIS